jgi:hypothetical protein
MNMGGNKSAMGPQKLNNGSGETIYPETVDRRFTVCENINPRKMLNFSHSVQIRNNCYKNFTWKMSARVVVWFV